MTSPKAATQTPLTYLAMLAGPLLLLPIEILIPYSYFLEEVFKSLALYLTGATTRKTKSAHLVAVTLGATFALSESVLYLYNFLMLNAYQALLTRFFWTTLMHGLTTYVLFLMGHQNKARTATGLALAILLHVFYNEVFTQYLR